MPLQLYRSSAGSGKTFTLVREYLKIVIANPEDFRHTLAITFTNKAANEMKQRVMESLQGLSAWKEDSSPEKIRKIMEKMQQDLHLDAGTIAGRATVALELILHHYSEFSVGTIDSFSHRIVRAFAHDFNIPVNFDVDMSEQELLTAAVDLLLGRAGEDIPLTRLLVRFLEERMEDEEGWNIERTLVDFSNVLLEEEGQWYISRLASLTLDDFNRIAGILFRRVREFENSVTAIASHAASLIASEGITGNSFYYGDSGIGKYFEKLAGGDMMSLDPNSYVRKTIAEERWFSARAPSSDRERITRIQNDLREAYQKITKLSESGKEMWALHRLMAGTIYPLAVLRETEQLMNAFNRQQNRIHISEFNRRIAGIVMNEPVPFIYERLGEKYHHILIDEFQDTSRLQWLNLLPLVENALAGGYFCLVVGDGKQAIYRFRGGDADQFTTLPRVPGSEKDPILRQRERVLLDHAVEDNLGTNFRSGQAIIRFNNQLFTWLRGILPSGMKKVYDQVEQSAAPDAPAGYVSIRFLPGKESGVPLADQTLDHILRIIASLGNDGFMHRDIAILCRAGSEASWIAKRLVLAGIPVVSAESLLLSGSPEVNFITGFMKYLHEPANLINQAALLNYIRLRRSMEDDPHELFREVASAGIHGERFQAMISRICPGINPGHLLSLTLYDLTEELIRIFSLPVPDPYIQFFLDAVIDFSGKGSSNVPAFLEWWETVKEKRSIIIPEGMDAVSVMTIHKAKGLQFPAVIYPFAVTEVKTSGAFLWLDLEADGEFQLPVTYVHAGKLMEQTVYREKRTEEADRAMLDLVNLFYVAMTRPSGRLYVLTVRPALPIRAFRSVKAFLAGFLQSTGQWEEGKDHYETGIPEKREPSGPPPSGAVSAQVMISRDRNAGIRLRRRAPRGWPEMDTAPSREQGNILHEILGGLNTAGGPDACLNRALIRGLVTREQLPAIARILKEVVGHPALEPFYSADAKVRNEAGIITPGGEMFRPDRVVALGERTAIIEYKSGRKEDFHRDQVDHYGNLLASMGYRKVEKYLVYLHDPVEVIMV